MAGLKTAVLAVRRAGQDFEIVLSPSVTLPSGVAATGIEAVADRDFAGGYMRPTADGRSILDVVRARVSKSKEWPKSAPVNVPL